MSLLKPLLAWRGQEPSPRYLHQQKAEVWSSMRCSQPSCGELGFGQGTHEEFSRAPVFPRSGVTLWSK